MPETAGKAGILVVDDEALIAADIESKLKSLGYDVCGTASTGERTLELVEAHHPDLVIMDIAIEGHLDGIETAEAIRDRWGIPVVFLTAYADSKRLERAKLAYPFGYLLKPLTDRDLKVTVEMALYVSKADRERRTAEEALRRSQEMLARTEEIANIGSWEWEIKEDRVTWSDEMFRISKLDPKDGAPSWAQHHSLQLADPDGLAKMKQAVELAIKDGTPYEMELRVPRRDGETRICLVKGFADFGPDGTVERLFGSLQDITEPKKAEEELRHKREEFELFFDSALDLLCIADTDGYFRRLNREWEIVLGYSLEDLEGRRFLDFVHPDDLQPTLEAISELAAQEKVLNFTNRYRRKDGTFRWIEWRSFPHGKFIYASARDITERKKAEEALRNSEKRYYEILEVNPLAVFLARDGRYIYCNPAGAAMMGFDNPEDMRNLPLETNIPPDLLGEIKERARRISEGETNPPIHMPLIRPDGTEIISESISKPIMLPDGPAILIIGKDITEQSKAENALKESEERYRIVADYTFDWEYWLAPDGSLPYVSPSCERITGYRREEFQNDPELLTQIIHPADRAIFLNHLVEIEHDQEKCAGLSFRITSRDGRERWIEHVCRPVIFDSGIFGGRRVSCRDITDRTKAEEALKMQSMVLDQIEDRVTITDLNGIITYVNESDVKAVGYSREELIGSSTEKYGEDPSRGATQREILQETLLNGHWRGEVVNYAADGHEIIMDCRTQVVYDTQGKAVALSGVATDITERKQAEKAIRESEEKYRATFESMPDIVTITRVADGQYSYVNEAFVEITGYSKEEVIGRTPRDINLYADFEDRNKMMSELRETGRLLNFEVKFRKKDGSYFDSLFSAKPLRIDDQDCLVALTKDITEQKKLVEAKKLLESQLQQAQKMEAVGTLAGGIAHDFNNLLQAINGYTQLLLMDKSEQDTDVPSLNAIHHAGSRASELVRQLLLFSRKADSTKRPTELAHEVEQAKKILERTIPKMVDIQITCGTRLWKINADPVQIEQMLLNLGTNAADAMPGGGKLLLKIENAILDDEYTIRHLGAEAGRYVLLTVSDTGHGMDRKTIDKIFDPFFTTKEFGKGTGLGLASVYGIVKNHDGFITCDSEVGHGTTFRIYFPALEHREPEDASTVAAKPMPRGTETILLVDDEEAIRGLARQALLRFGYTVLTATTGEEALEIFSAKPDEIDLIVMDLGMPGMGGLKCLQTLLQIDPSVKVVIASGYSVNEQVKSAMGAGARGYVGKPYQLADLLNTVRVVLDKKE
jgi:two-component system cell cycle sensor histidine kinase/response regulator CckA